MFFSELAKKYHLDEDSESFIIRHPGRSVFISKRHKIPIADSRGKVRCEVDIEDYLRETLGMEFLEVKGQTKEKRADRIKALLKLRELRGTIAD